MSAAHGIKPEQRTGLEHFKEALKEVSDEEGSTVHYSAGGSDPLPHHNPDNIGTRSEGTSHTHAAFGMWQMRTTLNVLQQTLVGDSHLQSHYRI